MTQSGHRLPRELGAGPGFLIQIKFTISPTKLSSMAF